MPDQMVTTSRWIRSEEVLSRELDGEIVLLDLQSEEYFGLDEVGAAVWELLGEPATLEQVVVSLVERYEVGEEQLTADLAELFKELADVGLIMRCDA